VNKLQLNSRTAKQLTAAARLRTHPAIENQANLAENPEGELVSAPLPTASQRLGENTHSRDEMNLAEFPLAALTTRVDKNVKTLEFRDTQRLKSGEIIEREWVITGADKFGLPTSTDDDVILGLIRLTMDNGFRSRKVHFTRYELMKVLRWAPEGRNYTRLTRSLDRLSGVRIKATNAFFDNASKSHQTCNFGIIDAYEIVSGRTSTADSSYFIWSEMLFDSFKVGFIKKLDLNLYFELNSSVSRRLYRYLDKHFYYRNIIERPLLVLAFEKLGLSRSYKYVSSVRQQLDPAIEELIKCGFLERAEFVGRGEQTSVRFYAGRTGAAALQSDRASADRMQADQVLTGRAQAERVAATGTTQSSASPAAPVRQPDFGEKTKHGMLERLLVDRGILKRQAEKLLAGSSGARLDRIEQIIGYYDALVARRDIRVSRNQVGFLYRAVEAPEKFVLPGERAALRPLFSQSAESHGLGAPGSGMPGQGTRPSRPELKIFRAERKETGNAAAARPTSGKRERLI
jgi:hypothetical protein